MIYMYLTFNGKRTRIATNQRVNIEEWNPKKEELRGNSNLSANTNFILNKYKRQAEEAFSNLQVSGNKINERSVKFAVTSSLFPHKVKTQESQIKKNHDLYTFVEWYIKENPNKISHGTMKTYMQLIPLFNELRGEQGDSFFEFSSVDLDWESTFTSFLFDKSHSRNTVGRHIKNIKALMTLSYRRKLHNNTEYKQFKKISENTKSIYLTEEEIKSIYETQVPINLEKVRDVFVFSCLTGLRFSDVMSVRRHHWFENYLEIKTKKTHDFLTIPLRKTAKVILEKYDGQIPRFYNSRYNKDIKDVCALVEILKVEESCYYTKGNKEIEVVKMKYQLVQSHTARRSFATNEYKRGTKTAVIMSITGHKTEKDFWTYIRLKQNEKAKLLMEDYESRDF